MNRFEPLGRAIAEHQDEVRRGKRDQARVYRALFGRQAVPHRRPAWPIAIAVAAMTVLALTVADRWFTSDAVHSGPYAAAHDAPRELAFADGTRITLKPGAEAHVDRVHDQGADIRLASGSLYASVVKRGGRWFFLAGDYRVEVTGTAFDLTWSAPRLTLVMHEGSVRVTGPGIRPMEVGAGEQLVLPRATPEVPRPAAEASAPAPSTTAPPSAKLTTSTWQRAAAAGDHKAAFEAVEPQLDRELARLDAGSMLRLATVARLSGHPGAASRVYRRLRERFPGTSAAAEAAFALGSLAFSSNPGAAETWFRTALVEARGGGLAASARGRLLELAQRRGDAAAAAEDYLRHHPDGPHAALARQILRR